jgi:hypothetical protein
MTRPRFVVRPGLCSWHVWERLGDGSLRRKSVRGTRREARELAQELNRQSAALDELTAESQRLDLY